MKEIKVTSGQDQGFVGDSELEAAWNDPKQSNWKEGVLKDQKDWLKKSIIMAIEKDFEKIAKYTIEKPGIVICEISINVSDEQYNELFPMEINPNLPEKTV